MLDENEVIAAGFKPLRRMPSNPVSLPSNSKPENQREILINDETGEKESSHSLWESGSWAKMEKSRGKTLERANSFMGSKSRTSSSMAVEINMIVDGKPKAIAIVDPFSTGAHLAAEAVRRGFKCVRVLSIWDSPVAALVQEGVEVEFDATIQNNDTCKDEDESTNQVVAALLALPFNIVAVIPGAETGVELADRVSARMCLRSNGEEGSLARRNKYLMGEKVRAYCTGTASTVRAVMQSECTSLQEMYEFVSSLPVTKCVVKPVQSAGTDDVFLCTDFESAEVAFNRILGKRNGLGLINNSVLVQEYLQGKEYVIDQVSKDGVPKLIAIWEYDKRTVNNANFVYFGMRLMPSNTSRSKQLKQYADTVLKALGIAQGPSHMEVMYNENEYSPQFGMQGQPCLVEVGARCQGGEGTWLPVAKECIGYTQVDATLDVYLGGAAFDSLPSDRYTLLKAGIDCDFVSRCAGIVRSFPGEQIIRNLPSFRTMSWEVKPGDFASVTIDCFTRPGCAQLVHEDPEQLERDFAVIHDLELRGRLIDYSVICPLPPTPGAVVVVDPFSTGANLAAAVIKMGHKLILVFSELNSPVAKLVAKSASYNPTLLIQHNNQNPDQDAAIKDTLDAIVKQGAPVLAIIPGAEPGVELADRLATRFGTRNNGEVQTEARRNKFLMQETVKAAGVRSIAQQLCLNIREVEDFYNSLTALRTAASTCTGTACVVKPNMSAGSDSVYLCNSLEECRSAFELINGHSNGLGHLNEGALCQEFLFGTEYVIDGVSRDGVYKVLAIWEYDKRTVNNANFVYFGMRLKSAEGDVEQSLIAYAAHVVAALGILHGPSHMEVKYDPVRGPCLVEVGARCQGGEGSWLPVAQECIGYTQLEATLNCYLRPDQFDNLPPAPYKLLKQGCEAFLVSYSSGTIKDIPGIDIVRTLPSFRRVEMLTQPGATIVPTIDCFTRPGSVQLVHEDSEALERDYEKVRELELEGLFDLME